MSLTPREFELLESTAETVARLDERFEAVEKAVEIHRLALFGNGGAPGLKANMRLVLWLVLGMGSVCLLAIATAVAARFTGAGG